MPEDYYSDAAPPAASAPEPAKPKADASESQVGELPLAVFPDPPKVGDVCDFEVVQVNEDSAVVRYATREKEETEKAPEPAPAPGGGGMNSMYE